MEQYASVLIKFLSVSDRDSIRLDLLAWATAAAAAILVAVVIACQMEQDRFPSCRTIRLNRINCEGKRF